MWRFSAPELLRHSPARFLTFTNIKWFLRTFNLVESRLSNSKIIYHHPNCNDYLLATKFTRGDHGWYDLIDYIMMRMVSTHMHQRPRHAGAGLLAHRGKFQIYMIGIWQGVFSFCNWKPKTIRLEHPTNDVVSLSHCLPILLVGSFSGFNFGRILELVCYISGFFLNDIKNLKIT